jgi:hypothetical protein
MKRRDNNPRAFAETVSITAWRSAYKGAPAVADLHIDVVFGEGRIGSENDSPVWFRLSLKQAEVHVVGDVAGVLSFPAKDIARSPVETFKVVTKETSSTASEQSDQLKLGGPKPTGELGASTKRTNAKGKETSTEIQLTKMKFQHRKTKDGYAWTVSPALQGPLAGQPWDAASPRLKIKDTAHSKRRLGDPPEPKIEVRCRREDLVISDIRFKKRSAEAWATLSRGKRLAVEQYIKDELLRLGFECGDLNDPFSQVVLADVVPEVE